ncbi:unnamed protein product [Danaus chrysippus]|uniref:(African queen) hypothetical protein n=1 Tax=Danaus chrysippus TaxID=151541 RepID=A0A8J2QHW3_9NEOP|nr:unnamed protein product [Danaus chrysippus]
MRWGRGVGPSPQSLGTGTRARTHSARDGPRPAGRRHAAIIYTITIYCYDEDERCVGRRGARARRSLS